MYIALCTYLIAVNIIAFTLMGIDKRRARRKMYRISESALLGCALVGGSVGAIAGMWTFRHKTRHWYFRYGLPFLLLCQLAIALWVAWPHLFT